MHRALRLLLLGSFIVALLVSAGFGAADVERRGFIIIHGVPQIKQEGNLCGAAVLAAVMTFWGYKTTQQSVAKEVFDETLQAASGGDLVRYARYKGLSAYSYAGSLADLKAKLELGMPIIVLHDGGRNESIGHYRIVIGCDDASKSLIFIDPLDAGIYSVSYDEFLALWKRFGNWSLLVCPSSLDVFSVELGDTNPVVHFDLAYAYRRHGEAKLAEQESRIAVGLGGRQVLVKSESVRGAKGSSVKSANSRVSARGR